MTVPTVKRRVENRARAGTQALALVSTPINACVLQALADGPKALIDLRRRAGSPPQTTMRGHLRTLAETGAVTRLRRDDFPGAVDFELTACGHGLWRVGEAARAWLGEAPEGPIDLGTLAAKSAIKALAEGWSTNVVRALAARPLCLTELNDLISGVSYPSLERRLGAMRLAGLIEKTTGTGRGTPYAVTDWLRRSVGPLAVAARWERLHVSAATSPVARLDVEAAFLLSVPLVGLDADQAGACRLAVELKGSGESRFAGVLVAIDGGRVVSTGTSLKGQAGAWVAGSIAAWLAALIDAEPQRLEIGGDCQLARELVDGLNAALFRPGQQPHPCEERADYLDKYSRVPLASPRLDGGPSVKRESDESWGSGELEDGTHPRLRVQR